MKCLFFKCNKVKSPILYFCLSSSDNIDWGLIDDLMKCSEAIH